MVPALNAVVPTGSVALYWDFENLHAGLVEAVDPGAYARPDNRFKVQEPLVNVPAVIALAASLGPLSINRAYCNWQFFGRYREVLLESAMDLVQLFPRAAAPRTVPTSACASMRWKTWIAGRISAASWSSAGTVTSRRWP
ncbi:hypothetical protein [Ramlibacter montanisoli]|uniref:hypothetical protein n=1 Tax=Ramlibacter montanisoli TaxID=2732512 RepID=UPI0035A17372